MADKTYRQGSAVGAESPQAGQRPHTSGASDIGPFWVAKVLIFMPPLRKYALLYQAGLEGGLFQLQGHNEFAC